ncbi:hypothetical protein [Nocardia sp. CA-290969]|uniref:hypothetical protein n=1 Tax=Nocardia sp. CA-290969 TaxID=3239986 RepID=UPI003D8DB5D9
MRRVLFSGFCVAAAAFGSVAGTAAAAPGTGLPLEPFTTESVPAPKSVQAPGTSMSGFGHESSGSAIIGPISTGSAEALTGLLSVIVTLSGGPTCPDMMC